MALLGAPSGCAAGGVPAEQLRGLAWGRQHVARAHRQRVHLRPAGWELLHTKNFLGSLSYMHLCMVSMQGEPFTSGCDMQWLQDCGTGWL